MSERERVLWEAIGRLEEAARREREAGELRAAAWRGLAGIGGERRVGPRAPFITDGIVIPGPVPSGPEASAVVHASTQDGTTTETWFVFTDIAAAVMDLGTIKGHALGGVLRRPFPNRLPWPTAAPGSPDFYFRPSLVPSEERPNVSTTVFTEHMGNVLDASMKEATRVVQAKYSVRVIPAVDLPQEWLPPEGEQLKDGARRLWTEELLVDDQDPGTSRAYLYGEWEVPIPGSERSTLAIHQVWRSERFKPPGANTRVIRSRKTAPAQGVTTRSGWLDWARWQLGNTDVTFASATVERWMKATDFFGG